MPYNLKLLQCFDVQFLTASTISHQSNTDNYRRSPRKEKLPIYTTDNQPNRHRDQQVSTIISGAPSTEAIPILTHKNICVCVCVYIDIVMHPRKNHHTYGEKWMCTILRLVHNSPLAHLAVIKCVSFSVDDGTRRSYPYGLGFALRYVCVSPWAWALLLM